MTSNGYRLAKVWFRAASLTIMASSLLYSTATLRGDGCSWCYPTGCSQCNIDGYCNYNGTDINQTGCTCDENNICTDLLVP